MGNCNSYALLKAVKWKIEKSGFLSDLIKINNVFQNKMKLIVNVGIVKIKNLS